MDGKKLREILDCPVTSETLDGIPWTTANVLSFVGLAAFGLWPVIVLIHAMWNHSFDGMVSLNIFVLDRALFPLVAFLSVTAYAFALVKLLLKKRSLSKTVRDNPTLLLFFALVVWMTANIPLTNGVTSVLLHGKGLVHESFPLHLEYFLCFLPLGLFLRKRRLELWLLRGMVIVSVLLALSSHYLWKNLQATSFYYDWRPSVASIFTNPNYYGYFLSVFIGLSAGLFVFAESGRWRGFYAAALILNTVTLSYNRTRGAWIGGLCACLFLVAANRVLDGKFRIWPVAALAIFISVLCLTGLFNGKLASISQLFTDVNALVAQPESHMADQAGSGRWLIWKNCIWLIRRHPFVGIGFEGVHVRNFQFIGNARPHNEFIQYALFYGVPGGLLYIAACAGVYIRAFRRRARLDSLTLAALTAAFGYLTGSFFGLTVYNTAPYFFIMLGLGYVWGETETPDAASVETETPNPIGGETETLNPIGGEMETPSAETETPDAASGETETPNPIGGETETLNPIGGETETPSAETETPDAASGETETPNPISGEPESAE